MQSLDTRYHCYYYHDMDGEINSSGTEAAVTGCARKKEGNKQQTVCECNWNDAQIPGRLSGRQRLLRNNIASQ